jgi:CheY-like chemotaxis protein
MAFVQVIHWKPEEAGELVEACHAAGFEAECNPSPDGTSVTRLFRARVPDAVVIDLNRLPSHGREVGVWLRQTKKTRHVPIVYVDGEPDKVERIRSMLPDATFTTAARVRAALKSAVRAGVSAPSVPPPAIERFGGRSAAQKIGIKPEMRVGVIDPAADYEALLGALPDGVELIEDPAKPQPLTLWFVHSFDGLMNSLDAMRRLAPRTHLWVVWRKGGNREVTFYSILTAGSEVGLALSKLCAVNTQWSAVWLVPRRATRKTNG